MHDGTDESADAGAETAPEPRGEVAVAELDGRAPRRRRLLALWGALAVLAIGGGALAVVAADDDPPRLPVSLGGATEEGSRAAASDLAMVAWIHYVAGDDLPLLGGDGVAYELSGDVARADVVRLTEALGLDVDPVRGDRIWRAESAQGTAEVYEGGGGAWWYSKAEPDRAAGRGSSGSAGSSASAAEDRCAPDALECSASSVETPFAPPADLPSRADAEAIALDLLRATGAPVDGAKVTVDGPYEAWYVTVEAVIDGRAAAGMYFNVAVGSKGEIVSAGGVLNAPKRLGTYPVVDTRGAIDRLNAGTAFGTGGNALAIAEVESEAPELVVEEELAPGVDVVDPVAPTVGADDSSSGGGADGSPGTDPGFACDTGSADGDDATASCLPSYEPPSGPIEVVLHDAEPVLVVLPASDGSSDAYLVPGYRMTGDDGAVLDAPAIDDESILPIATPTDAPHAPDTPVGSPGAARTEPATRCAPLEPGPDGDVIEICLDPEGAPPAKPQADVPVGER